MKRYYKFALAIVGMLAVIFILYYSTTRSNKNLDSWVGEYHYTAIFPHSSGEMSYVIEYIILIYEEENKYYAQITNDGWWTMTRVLAQVTGNQNKIEIAYLHTLPDDIIYGNEWFDESEVLWHFERNGDDINTVWMAARSWHPTLSDVEGEIIGKYFEEKVDREQNTLESGLTDPGNVGQDRFSELYESPLAAEYGKVAYLDWSAAAGENVLVVEDLFEENGYHEEFYLDIPKVVTAVTDAIFLDDNFFCILYRSQDLQEDKLSIVDLRDGTVMTGFSQVVYPIDQELYNTETEREYKEAFYAAITNQAVMDYQGGRAVYFRDYFQGLKDLNDLKYLFLDCDGDGLPELVMGGFSETKGLYSDGYCVLKYVPEEERVAFSYHMYSGYMPLGSSQWGSERKNSKEECYTYQAMDAQGVEEADIYFEHTDLNGEARYYMRVGWTGFYIEQAQWQAFSKVLKAALEHPLEMVSFAEAFGEGFSTEMPDDGKDHYQWLFESWTDFYERRDLPYGDDNIVAILKDAYGEIDFKGEFDKGDLESYDKYKKYFLKLLDNEIPFSDLETGDRVYLKDFEGLELDGDTQLTYDKYQYMYYFFDMDGDGAPELGIRNDDNHRAVYIFKYDEETEGCFLWYTMDNFYYSLFGSRKVAWIWDGRYLAFYQLDIDGNVECEVFGISTWFNEEESLHAVMLPEYRDEEKKIEVTDIMKEQGFYDRLRGNWYLRVTEEQYEELMVPYWEAYYLAEKEEEEVTYTYEELFEFATPW